MKINLPVPMDSKVSEFLKSGNTDATSRSHRYATKSYSEFLLAQITSRDSDRMQFFTVQLKDLRAWNPSEPIHLCPKNLAVDAVFARFLIETFHSIWENKFSKPTLRARQGWITWSISTLGMSAKP